jgi:hypothetical protein
MLNFMNYYTQGLFQDRNKLRHNISLLMTRPGFEGD